MASVASRLVPSQGPAPRQLSPKVVDVFLYGAAAVSYIGLSIYHKWLLDWIIGPCWLVAWVWGVPALWRLVRGRPVRPQRGRRVNST
jgi:hypothetical protein